jgi:hypothetical protein
MKTKSIPEYESQEEAFAAEFEGLEYVDNQRIAIVGDDGEMAKYVEQMRKGCCGSFDTVVSIKYGETYYLPHLIGCNYGH